MAGLRRTVGVFVCLAALFLPAAAGYCAGPGPDGAGEQVERAVRAVRPALVRIRVVSAAYRQGREVDREGFGSGVIISDRGLVLTNHHVAGRAKRVTCTLADGEEIEGELVGTDPMTDISVIRLRAPENRSFPYAVFGDSDKLRAGDRVLAMGSPYAFSQSVTKGIVSNTGLVMPPTFWPFNQLTLEGEDVGSLVRWIGHDAAIFPGNSGGPLVDMAGRVVGINEITMGLGGAIPGNLALEVAGELVTHGRVRRGWLGLEIQPLLRFGEAEKGALVSGTVDGSPAERAGFRPGDILLALAGEPVNVRLAEEMPLFNRLVSGIEPGARVEARIRRAGREKVFEVIAAEREASRPATREIRRWGFVGRDLSRLAALELGRETAAGVLVESVRPGGPADEARPRISAGDIITAVDRRPVVDLAALEEMIEELDLGGDDPETVLVDFERAGERHLAALRHGRAPAPRDSGRELPRSWLAVESQVLTREIAERLGIPEVTGVRLTRVYPGTGAGEAGLRVGDLVVAIDGERIDARRAEDTEALPVMTRRYPIGSEVELTVLRGDEQLKKKVVLGPSPPATRELGRYRDESFGFAARDLSIRDRAVAFLEGRETGGVLVESVDEGSWASLGHLRPGDLVTAVSGIPVATAGELGTAMREIAREEPAVVVFRVRRGIYARYLEIETLWP